MEKLEKEVSVVKILKRIQKLTAITNSMYKFLNDNRVGKMADKMYRSHVVIPTEDNNNDQNLFDKLDRIGQIDLENEDDGDGELNLKRAQDEIKLRINP